MKRQIQVKHWLKNSIGLGGFTLDIASADASFRRYFRVKMTDVPHQSKSYIVMDAPPDKESLEPFAGLSTYLRAQGINTPKIYAKDKKQGFLLLTDFGSTCYLDVLNQDNVDTLYQSAIRTIVNLQKMNKQTLELPRYDANLLQKEMLLFKDWYLLKFAKMQLTSSQEKDLQNIFDLLAKSALVQPQVFVHRDFHSRNLMYLQQGKIGIIDFQDAVEGPITYDLVSLIKDCYIDWPDEKIAQWLEYFHQALLEAKLIKNLSFAQFEYYLDFMGVQRHLKAVGIFARLYMRDGKPGYINDIPRTLNYIQKMADKYSELKPLQTFCVFNQESLIV